MSTKKMAVLKLEIPYEVVDDEKSEDGKHGSFVIRMGVPGMMALMRDMIFTKAQRKDFDPKKFDEAITSYCRFWLLNIMEVKQYPLESEDLVGRDDVVRIEEKEVVLSK